MRRLFGNAIIMIATLLLLSNCAFLQNLIGQYQAQTYTFDYNGKEYSVLLPELVPIPSESAEVVLQNFWSVNVRHVRYTAGIQPYPKLPTASFWFTEDFGIFGLVWHTLKSDGTIKHTPFLIVKGLPIPASVESFDKFLYGLYQEMFEPKPDNSV